MTAPTEDAEESTTSRARIWLGGLGAPIVFVALWVAPLPIPENAHHLAAVLGAVFVLWVSEVIPIAVTALLIAPLLILCGVVEDPKEAFRHYADPILFLFVGSFFIAEAMQRHGLDRRVGRAILRLPGVRALPSRVRTAMMIATALLSMWVANTASTAVFLPIVIGMVGTNDLKNRAASGTIFGVAVAASTGGMGTFVGTPPNLITARFLDGAGMRMGFVDWFAIGFPTAMVTTLAAVAVLHFMMPPRAAVDATAATVPAYERPAPWSIGEIVTAIAFAVSVVGWSLPGVCVALGFSWAPWLEDKLEPGVVALIASAILFAAPDGKGARVLRWREAAQIDWGVIMLFGGGLALGGALLSTGLAEDMGEGFVAVTRIREVWTLTAVLCVFTIFFSEIVSNTAAATMLVPLVIGIATELEAPIAPPVLAVGLAASCGFMLPIATGPNALAYGTGRIAQIDMMRVGVVLDLVCGVVIFTMLRVLCPLYGWS
jgi:sodium-dependent dicarboxylate transporter 2/3/5